MLKYLLFFFTGLLICQNVIAQHADTSLFYKNDLDKVVSTKDSADYIMMVIKPDTSTVYKINEYYLNGKRKLSETALYNAGKFNEVMLTGPCIEFYPNGHTKSIINYTGGYISGDIFRYYPNGKIYAVEKGARGIALLVSCRDSTGKVLATDGKGDWIMYNDKFDKVIEQGQVEDSLKNGEWQGNLGDSARYVINYKKGKFVSGIGYDAANKAHPFTTIFTQASFKGPGTYSDFLAKNIHYPYGDRQNNVQGKVIVQFVIEVNGKPIKFNVLRAPDKSMGSEAIRVISLMLWNPAVNYGIPVSSYFTLPINFSLTKSR